MKTSPVGLRTTMIAISILVAIPEGMGQQYKSPAVFAHNDYVRDNPFHTAYDLEVGYIEADVFLIDGQLAVAHHREEIEPGRTLQTLYLEPLRNAVRRNNGYAYQHPEAQLTLLIDLKTEGMSTLNRIVEILDTFPELIECPTLQFVISGNVPDPALWDTYPPYIYFDGRPGIRYTKAQLQRVSMISTSFGQHVKWDGRGLLSTGDEKTIKRLLKAAHQRGKKFRFWGTPDFEEAWRRLMELKMDVLVTDDVVALVTFLQHRQ